jgi:DNA-binding NtrC family response regulator
MPRAGHPLGTVESVIMTSDVADASVPTTAAAVWIVEDEPAAAALAADLCALNGTLAYIYRDAQLFLDALHSEARPAVLVLDWRLERGLSAPLFMAARHREPALPVVFWTGTSAQALPQMIQQDPRARVVDKAEGTAAFERALRWALDLVGIAPPVSRPPARR